MVRATIGKRWWLIREINPRRRELPSGTATDYRLVCCEIEPWLREEYEPGNWVVDEVPGVSMIIDHFMDKNLPESVHIGPGEVIEIEWRPKP